MLGDQIRVMRLAKNLSQVALAKNLGVSKQSVSNWENNNIQPSIDILIKIAVFFGCTTDYLLELDSSRSIESSNLTPEQAAHIQQLVKDFECLNEKSKNVQIP